MAKKIFARYAIVAASRVSLIQDIGLGVNPISMLNPIPDLQRDARSRRLGRSAGRL
jgi:hypothetical protein